MNVQSVVEWATAALFVINIVVSIAVSRSDYFERSQKGWQIAIVWLVPVVGCITIGFFLGTQRGSAPSRTEPTHDLAHELTHIHPPRPDT